MRACNAADKYRTVFAVHVELLFPSTRVDDNKPKTAAEMYHPKKPKVPQCLKLHDISSVDSRKSNIIVSAHMVLSLPAYALFDI